MKRRNLIAAVLVAGALPLQAQTLPLVEVWKDPNCGCCKDWIRHLEANGFRVKAHDQGNTAARKRVGLPDALGSCHTAVVSTYVIEGHVPAEAIEKMLTELPAIMGIAVPEMPTGSPGMEIPGFKPEPFKVMSFANGGEQRVFLDFPEGYRRKL